MRTMELMIAVQLVPKPRTRVGPRRTMRIWARTVRSRRVPKKPNVLTNEKIEQNTSFNLFLEFCFMLKHTCAMRVFRIDPKALPWSHTHKLKRRNNVYDNDYLLKGPESILLMFYVKVSNIIKESSICPFFAFIDKGQV